MKNISFLIISPLLGYKEGNKKFLKMNSFKRNIELINNNFTNPDIVVVTGQYNNFYKEKRSGYRICQNQLYEHSGESEQIRIGLDNVINSKLIIMREDCVINFQNLKKFLKGKKDFLLTGDNDKNPGVVEVDSFAQNISFGLDNFFDDVFDVEDRLREVDLFVNKSHNLNKKFYEMINYLISINPIKVYKNENIDS